MAHPNYSPSSVHFCATNRLKSFCLLKAFIIIVVFPKKEAISNAVATENWKPLNSVFVAPHVAAEKIISATKHSYGNSFSINQIKIGTFQRRTYNVTDIDFLSLETENCSAASSFTGGTSNINVSKMGSNINSSSTTPNMAKTNTIMNTTLNLNKGVSAYSPLPPPSSPLVLQHHSLLSRPRRYLSFPEGSSFSVAVCFTVGIIGNPRYNYMSFGLNWGVAYDLPNTTWILHHLHGFAKRPVPVAVWHRRSRRSLYKEIENIVDNMGYNGRDCVLRALCESRQYFQKTKLGMIGEMLRAIFSLPKMRVFTRELVGSNDIVLYDKAYRKARTIAECSEKYECGFSLLELAFGKYSTPPNGYYAKH